MALPPYFPGVAGPVTRPLTFPSGNAAFESASGSLTAGATVTEEGTASLSGEGALAAAGAAIPSQHAAMSGAGTLAGAATTPAGLSFVIAAVCGDNSGAGTKITPAGWTALHTVTASNGSDHTGDAVLAAAFTTTSTSPQAVSGTATSAEGMSGMITGVLCGAPSPVPPGINPNWPYVAFEAAFGSGYQTPPDEMEWVNLQTLANGFRCIKWDETTGIQYELDALESSELELILDNPDGYLSPENPSSPFYPYVVPGTPVRLRVIPPAATGAAVQMVIQRNMERWPQSWDEQFRGRVNGTGTDQWSVMARPLPTSYRAEVEADAPYAWWPCDDPLITPLPTALVNAALCNSNHLNIVTSPNGLNVTGTIPTTPTTFVVYSATEDFAASQGWMYGDPLSAAWQQEGNGAGTRGRYLSCNDTNFPPLSGGVAIEGWWNLGFAATGSGQLPGPIGQPAGNIVLIELASTTGAVGTLFVNSSGALQITIGGTTSTIYSGADLRNTTWFTVVVNLTASSWQAWVNGGVVATASGTFGSIAGTWTWFLANAGTGSGGAPPTSGDFTGSGNVQVSHLAVYSNVLPAARVMAHAMAAYAAFGQLPAPSLTAQFIGVPPGGSFEITYGPDGLPHSSQFFEPPTIASVGTSTLAAVVTSVGGGLTSSPSAPETINIIPGTQTQDGYMWLTATGIAPQYAFYTAGGAGDEQLAATIEPNYLFVDSYATGAAPPATASALGDTAQNRIERLLQAGQVTTPQRCIDASTTAVVAALDTGGQACGTSVSNIATSDGGMLFIDSCGNLVYLDRPHLAAMQVAWVLGENTGSGEIPYLPDVKFDTDPQQVKNIIEVSQFAVAPGESAGSGGSSSGSAETSSGLTFGPDATRSAAVAASQVQNGPAPYSAQSYLQSVSEIQAQSNWLFDVFGSPRQRISSLTVNAMPMTNSAPGAWLLVLGANVGDLIQVTRRPPGQPSFGGVWRISRLKRTIDWGSGTASLEITADVEPSYYPS